MAEGQTLYDAKGNAVQVNFGPAGGFVYTAPDATVSPVPPAQVGPIVAPGTSQGPQSPAASNPAPAGYTTQQVQGSAEYVRAGEVQGGDTYVPFGPALTLETDEAGGFVDPGYSTALTDQGIRRTFRVAPSIGLMPLLRFAHAAKAGLDTDDLEGMAALYDMINDCVHPDDWSAFMAYATEIKAEDEELMEFVSSAMEIISARPRKPRGSSSATSRRTLPRSRGNSSGPASVIPDGAIRPPEVDGLMPVSDLVN